MQQRQDIQKSVPISIIEYKYQLINDKFQQKEEKTEKAVLTGHTDWVRVIDICKQRNLLASGSSDKTVKLWNLENNSLLKTYKYNGDVFDVAFSNQGNLLAFGGYSRDCQMKLIDISHLNKDNILIDYKVHFNTFIWRLTFSNDSKSLISCDCNKQIIIWDVILKKKSFQLNSEFIVQDAAFSCDDTLIASNSIDGKIRIWTIQNQKLLISKKAHSLGIGVKFSNDQKMLVSSGDDLKLSTYFTLGPIKLGTIKLWSLEYLNQRKLLLIRKFKASTNSWVVLFSPCMSFIIINSNKDDEITVLNSQTAKVVKLFKFKPSNRDFKVSVAISKDFDIIAYGEDNNIVVRRQK